MLDEASVVKNLSHLIKEMGKFAKGTAEVSAVQSDLAVINPHASPLPFYFTVQAAIVNLFSQVALMGRGRRSSNVADKIYSDAAYLQENYNYWVSAGDGQNASAALFGSHIAGFTGDSGGGSINTSAGQTESVPPLIVHPHG
jgi:hypothetical protein